MKDIKEILEGLLSNDISSVEAAIPELDFNGKAWRYTKSIKLVSLYLEEINEVANRQMLRKPLVEIKKILDGIGKDKIASVLREARKGRVQEWYEIWNAMFDLQNALNSNRRDPIELSNEDKATLDDYKMWNGLVQLANKIFEDKDLAPFFSNGAFYPCYKGQSRVAIGVNDWEPMSGDIEIFWRKVGIVDETAELTDRIKSKLQKLCPEEPEFDDNGDIIFSKKLLENM